MLSLFKKNFDEEEDKLARMLKKAFQDEDYRTPFYEVFLLSDIYFIVLAEDKTLSTERDSLAALNVKIIYDGHKNPYYPIFSSPDEAAQLIRKENETLATMNAADFLMMTIGRVVLLNPDSHTCKTFSLVEIEMLLRYSTQNSVGHFMNDNFHK